jgi:hypothetical protein
VDFWLLSHRCSNRVATFSKSYGEPDAVNDAKFLSRSHDALIRVYDDLAM